MQCHYTRVHLTVYQVWDVCSPSLVVLLNGVTNMDVLTVQTALANLIYVNTPPPPCPVLLLTTPALITAVEVPPEGDLSLSQEGSSPQTVKDEECVCGVVSEATTVISQSQTVHSVGKSLHPQHTSQVSENLLIPPHSLLNVTCDGYT